MENRPQQSQINEALSIIDRLIPVVNDAERNLSSARNWGFLDVLGVNTLELSRMVYTARECGAIGSKITGAGGGGSIIALCPNSVDEVARGIAAEDNVLKIRFTRKGVSSRVYK